MKLEKQVSSFVDDPNLPCEAALKKMYKLLEKYVNLDSFSLISEPLSNNLLKTQVECYYFSFRNISVLLEMDFILSYNFRRSVILSILICYFIFCFSEWNKVYMHSYGLETWLFHDTGSLEFQFIGY